MIDRGPWRWSALILVILLMVTPAVALSPFQHRAKGTVTVIDTNILVIAPTPPDKEPTTFVIKADRTTFRADGKKSPTLRPAVGEKVTLYYKKELGDCVATEVSWKTTASPSDPKQNPTPR